VHLASDVAHPLDAVNTEGLAPPVPQHAGHLRVLLPVLFEHQLPLLVIRLVLPLFLFFPPFPLFFGISA